jgi:regulator of sigma E protease
MNFLDYLFAVIPMLGILIFVHELGHFLVAKACGVRVLKFSLGFGPPIGFGNLRLRWVRGGTEYVIAWFPLGGFVKMLGEQMQGVQGEDVDFVEDAAPDEYLNAKPTWQKLAITFAGPVMNLLLPVVAFTGMLASGYPQLTPVVGMVEAESPAYLSGLRSGDEIARVDGEVVTHWDTVVRAVREHDASPVEMNILRDGESLSLEIPVLIRRGLDEFGMAVDIGWIGVGHRRLPAMLGVPRSDSPASIAGLMSGDRIEEIAGKPVNDWEELLGLYAAVPADDLLPVQVIRGVGEEAETLTLEIPATGDLDSLGVIPAAVLVRSVSEGMPAAAAGLEQGDLILAVDGEPVGSFATFAEIVRSSEGRSLEITYARDGITMQVDLQPKQSKIPGPFEIEGMEQTVYLIGITHALATLPGPRHAERILNPLVSVPRATAMTLEASRRFLKSLAMLIGGEVSLDNVSGPIGIAEIARKSLDMGWLVYLNTMIFISINLGFLNLLPIPILDGGQALIIIVEGVKRSPISLRSREIVQQIGLTFLMMLMGLAFWNDLSRHWSVFVEWLRGTGL